MNSYSRHTDADFAVKFFSGIYENQESFLFTRFDELGQLIPEIIPSSYENEMRQLRLSDLY